MTTELVQPEVLDLVEGLARPSRAGPPANDLLTDAFLQLDPREKLLGIPASTGRASTSTYSWPADANRSRWKYSSPLDG